MAYCEHCYNGRIVYLKIHNIFICESCHKQEKIIEKVSLNG